MNIFSLIFFLQLCWSEEIDEMYYLREYYGPKFHVDYHYPKEYTFEEYCTLNKNYDIDNQTLHSQYPSNLWLAIIHTVPSKIQNMINTRNTWCQQELQEKYGFKCIFILVESTVYESPNKHILEEMNETYHDIYYIELPDLKEQWFTLQQKNINAYILAMELFPNYSFYSRVDDQIMVTVDVLSSILLTQVDTTAVIGEIISHRPRRSKRSKYFDPLANRYPRYFPFPAGYLSLFSKDIIEYIARWDNYYIFAPSSLEDPGFGHWVYRFAKDKKKRINFIYPKYWGGNVKDREGDYLVYHCQKTRLNQTKIFEQQKERGYMQI